MHQIYVHQHHLRFLLFLLFPLVLIILDPVADELFMGDVLDLVASMRNITFLLVIYQHVACGPSSP